VKQYHFVSTWEVEAPMGPVFDLIAQPVAWPQWWRGVTDVRLLAAGEPDGTGIVHRFTFRSLLPYDLTFDVRSTLIDPPARVFGDASGDLVGRGRWFLIPTPGGTRVRYEWDVATSEWWMNALGLVAGPLFSWNHDVIMRWGEEGMRARLGLPPRPRGERPPLGRFAAVAGVAALALAFLGLRRRGRR